MSDKLSELTTKWEPFLLAVLTASYGWRGGPISGTFTGFAIP